MTVIVDQITKEYPGVLALDQASFKIKKGSIHGFLGPNGAGKSTAIKIMANLIRPNSGEVYYKGKSIQSWGKGMAKLIGVLPEVLPLYEYMQVREYLSFVFDLFCDEKVKREKWVQQTIERCGLEAMQTRIIAHLSSGYKKKVGIAQAIVHRPEIIILDEPTSALDPHAILEVRRLIQDLACDHTIFLSSHQLKEMEQLCDEVTIIEKGRVLTSGPLSSLANHYQRQIIINAKCKVWDTGLEQKIKRQFNIERIEREGDELMGLNLKFYFTNKGDHSATIAQFMVENKCGLQSINEIEMGLEDIFCLATETKTAQGEMRQ